MFLYNCTISRGHLLVISKSRVNWNKFKSEISLFLEIFEFLQATTHCRIDERKPP